ncbi:MAG TPA: Rieske (2Fe-2S) protein [Bacteroidota bacterium]|nr:Rieske (2Fe-2S) protein [Bacteroidota bacterium]
MNRKEFLSTLGLGAAAMACSYCLNGCKPLDNPITAPTNVDFTLDLTNSANAALNANGGYLYHGGIIVAKTVDGAYVALSQTCTHAGGTVEYIPGTNRFYCPNHGSNFATNGSVINGPAPSPLAQYATELTGTSLRVHS